MRFAAAPTLINEAGEIRFLRPRIASFSTGGRPTIALSWLTKVTSSGIYRVRPATPAFEIKVILQNHLRPDDPASRFKYDIEIRNKIHREHIQLGFRCGGGNYGFSSAS
jgi:hypothetical protein